MKDYKYILFEERDGVALVTLNDPERRNPLTEETKTELLSAMDRLEQKKDLRALVITGKGTCFCAGGDLRKITQELPAAEIRQVMQRSQQLLRRLINLEKPVVTAVNGDAFGLGCNLAIAVDFAIASEKARFCEVFVKLGVIPDFGALYLLPRLIGLWKSREMVYFGRVVGAEEAAEIGLVYRVVPHEELEKEAMALAGRLAAMPTLAIGRAKRILNRAFDTTLEEVLDEEVKSQIFLSQTEDHREGLRAMHEKRKPRFKGE